ncbi:MAG TPA: hypothetical protein G4N96_03135 [Chloroflexi bacterium]|nr:hypothetical protein [Chloroflexota bacterium]
MKIPPTIAAITHNSQLTASQRRRIMIDISQRRIKPGSGSGHAFLRRRTAMHYWPDLRPILRNLTWAIAGAVATRAYMPERATRDLDILVHHRDGDDVLERLKIAGFQLVSPLTIPGFLLQSPNGVEVDVIFGNSPWIDEALSHPKQDPAGYPVLDLPYLVLMKLEASRTLDLGDLARMLGLAAERELERVRNAVKRYAPDAIEDIESLIYLGQLELKN